MLVKGTFFTTRTLGAEKIERRLPESNYWARTCTVTPTSSHCKGQTVSLKVRDWSLLFSLGRLSVTNSFLEEPTSAQTHPVCMCPHVLFFFSPCFELWLQEVPGLLILTKGLPDLPPLQWGGILPADYHIISITLASHYCDTAWLAVRRCAISSSRPAPSSPHTAYYNHCHSLFLFTFPQTHLTAIHAPLSLTHIHVMNKNLFNLSIYFI